MRIPVDWLREFAPNDLPVRELAAKLTDVGLEVEAIEDAVGAPVFDIKVTPNRGDCLSVLGVARELAMTLRRELRYRPPVVVESGPPAEALVSIVLDDPRLCPRYSARIVRNVRIAPSPMWAQRRLELCGLRPINNVVDATNLVMLELGQPLHAFDYDLLRAPQGERRPQIVVRRARVGERLVTIDGEDRSLTPEILLITDPSGPIALAGIMGGTSTEIHSGTTTVLLESAHFDPGTIRRGARALGMSTEASYRFERTVDPGGTVRALDRACELIGELSEGAPEVAAGVVDAYPEPIEEAQIWLRPARANALLGLTLSADTMAEHLRRLGLCVEVGDVLRVRVPTFRQDLKQEIDLVEEVARVEGYDRLPETLPGATQVVGRLSAEAALEREVRGVMRGLGLSEAVTSSLESPEALARLGIPEGHPMGRAVRLTNAKTVDRSQLRTTLLSSLLDVVAENRRRGVEDVSLFDLGRVYFDRGPDQLPDQPQHLGIAGMGVRWRGRWALPRGKAGWDFYTLKAVVESVVAATTRMSAEFERGAHPALEPARTASVSLDTETIGFLGEVSASVRAAYDLPDPVFVAEIDLEVLRKHIAEEPRYRPVSRFPSVSRDVAFLLPRGVDARRAESVIREAAGENLESLSLFDAYEGKPLPEGQRNLAFSLIFRRHDRTLTDDEVSAVMEGVRSALRARLGAQIRD